MPTLGEGAQLAGLCGRRDENRLQLRSNAAQPGDAKPRVRLTTAVHSAGAEPATGAQLRASASRSIRRRAAVGLRHRHAHLERFGGLRVRRRDTPTPIGTSFESPPGEPANERPVARVD
jgi:hypothetical protein